MIATRLIPVLAIVVAFLTGATVWLAVAQHDTQKRLGPVGVVGPCREFGPDNPECRRQSRLIVESCLTHRDCRSMVRATFAHENHRRGQQNESNGSADLPPDQSAPQGGGTSTGSPPPSQPGPPPSGGGSSGNPPNPPPVGNPPTTPPTQGPVSDVLDQVCELNPAGIRVCL